MTAMTPGYQALRAHAAWLDLSARGKIRVSGEDRARHHAERRKTGIPYAASEVTALQDEAKKAGIQPLVVADRPIGS